jgi:hypothetical protein
LFTACFICWNFPQLWFRGGLIIWYFMVLSHCIVNKQDSNLKSVIVSLNNLDIHLRFLFLICKLNAEVDDEQMTPSSWRYWTTLVTPPSPIDGNLQNHIWYSTIIEIFFSCCIFHQLKKQKTINFTRVVPHRFILLSY